jgi:hypothetical protein
MDTKVKSVEVLPLVKYYMDQLELARLFDKYVPNSNDAEVAPAQVLCMLVMTSWCRPSHCIGWRIGFTIILTA